MHDIQYYTSSVAGKKSGKLQKEKASNMTQEHKLSYGPCTSTFWYTVFPVAQLAKKEKS
jgi:hypothetical protein